jgi:hypothetical protein
MVDASTVVWGKGVTDGTLVAGTTKLGTGMAVATAVGFAVQAANNKPARQILILRVRRFFFEYLDTATSIGYIMNMNLLFPEYPQQEYDAKIWKSKTPRSLSHNSHLIRTDLPPVHLTHRMNQESKIPSVSIRS